MAEKNRYWSFVYYPEIATVRDYELGQAHTLTVLRNYLESTNIKYAISPLHDKDINPDGEPKKKHYHVLMAWDGPTTFKRASEVLGSVAANGHIESVLSARGYYRYLTHQDNPEKFQYSQEDILTGNGFNPAELMSETDKKMLLKKVCEIAEEHQIKSIRRMSKYLLKEGLLAEWSVFSSNANFFKGYFASWYDEECVIGKQLQKKAL